jgi:hypothetical protein
VKKVRERMRYLLGAFGAPKPGAYALQPGCQEVPIPFAMTRDVRYAASQDNGIEVDELATDKEPSWMTSTLRSELREDVQFGCVMDQKMRAMHGRGRDCDDPLKRLNRALSTARRPMQFVPLESLFASEAEGVSFDGAVISIQRTLLGAKQPGIEVPIGAFRCGENEAPRLVGVVLGAAVAYVYVESNDPIDKPAKQAPPKDDIFSPEGTWLQDLVPEIPETRKVRVLAIKLAPT